MAFEYTHFFFCARVKLKSSKEHTHIIYIYIYIYNMLTKLINSEWRGLTSIYETKI